MTAFELITHLNKTYGTEEEWPATLEVDAETYGHCCQHVITRCLDLHSAYIMGKWINFMRIACGTNNGIMFKNVELILKQNEHR